MRTRTKARTRFGYNLGSLALGGTLFNSIAGNWTVPLNTSEEMDLIDSNSNVIGTPTARPGRRRLQRVHVGDLVRGAEQSSS